MSNIQRVIQKVYSSAWLATPGVFQSVDIVLKSKIAGATVDPKKDWPGTTIDWTIDDKGIATIPITGVLGQKLSLIEKISGGTDYMDLENAIGQALAQDCIGIIFEVDSGGGMATGCPELADVIQRVPVPTVAFTSTMACSAAYWIASACDYVVSTISADTGSIGVIMPWVDSSKLWELDGLQYDPITNEGASLKGIGYGPSLTDEQRQSLQRDVNHIAGMFKAHVVSQRPNLNSEVFKAGLYWGNDSLSLGLIDKVGNYADAYNLIADALGFESNLPNMLLRSGSDLSSLRAENAPNLAAFLDYAQNEGFTVDEIQEEAYQKLMSDYKERLRSK